MAGLAMPLHTWADDDPAAYFENDCVDCHQLKKKPLDDKHLTRDEWKKAIEKMLELDKLDPVPSPQFINTMLELAHQQRLRQTKRPRVSSGLETDRRQAQATRTGDSK
jgi:hypothetical protein